MPSGRFGLIDGLSTVEAWELSDAKGADTYVASNTRGGTVRGGGIRSWSGSFRGRGTIPPVMPNEVYPFDGYTSPTTGVEGTDGIVYSGNVLVTQISLTWNWATNLIFAWTAQFQGFPGLTIASATPTLDASIPPTASACGTSITYGADIEIPKLTQATLTITANVSSEANSSTTSGGECYTSPTPGPIDWTLAMTQEDHLRGVSGYPDLGSNLELKAYVDATNFWHLKFGRLLDYSGLQIDRNGQLISRTINVAMQASDGTSIGKIVKPGETTPWWGVA